MRSINLIQKYSNHQMLKLNSSVKNIISAIALVTVTAVSWSNQAQAVTINGVSSGTWINPEPGFNSNPQFSGEGSNTFEWGQVNDFENDANQLKFSGNSFSTTNDSLFKLGDLTYFNGITFTETLVDNVSLNTSINLTSPNSLNQDFTFRLGIISTFNTDDAQESTDFVFFPSNFPNQTFDLNGTPTTLKIAGFSKDGGATIFSEFHVLENASDQAGLYGKFVNVPEPSYAGSEMLALVGLGGLYLLKRKLKLQKLVVNKN